MPLETLEKQLEYLEGFLKQSGQIEEKTLQWHSAYGMGMKSARENRGFSLRHVADSSGMSVATIQRLEKGYSKWTLEYAKKYLETLK